MGLGFGLGLGLGFGFGFGLGLGLGLARRPRRGDVQGSASPTSRPPEPRSKARTVAHLLICIQPVRSKTAQRALKSALPPHTRSACAQGEKVDAQKRLCLGELPATLVIQVRDCAADVARARTLQPLSL